MIGLSDYFGKDVSPRCFDIGDLVRHKIHGYRGVIVGFDSVCKAHDNWYNSNKTQPPRDQPWYNVLVHDSGGLSTYAAQSNLEADASERPINHPRIGCYFKAFEDGRYVPHAKKPQY